MVDPDGRLIISAVCGTEFDDAAALEQLLPYLRAPWSIGLMGPSRTCQGLHHRYTTHPSGGQAIDEAR